MFISASEQCLHCYEQNQWYKTYQISTGKNGLGERIDSQCTPRGWHRVHARIGMDALENSVFVARRWTGEIYSEELSISYPQRDWILSRIIQLDGLEEGRNKGGIVDTLKRCIYIHGTPDSTQLGIPGSHGCIRMRNADIVQLATWVELNMLICIE